MTNALTDLRHEVRDFLAERLAAGAFTPVADCWLAGWDEDFSRSLGERGWLGMTLPTQYGGHGRSYLERYVVTQELLCAGAPVAAHWIADRQVGPSLLTHGTHEQRERFLPAIARGECYFAIGMSEPDSGSDLASVRTRARKVDGGWRVSGTKVWTSGAQHAHAFFVLARSSPLGDDGRHAGLSQFLVPLDAEGVTVSPIVSMDGSHHFNEVALEDVLVPDGDVIGQVGDGWQQVTSELKFERSGPERFLSTFVVLDRLLDSSAAPPIPTQGVGRHVARLAGLHHLSFDVAQRLQEGKDPALQATMVKMLGTVAEGDLAEDLSAWVADRPDAEDDVVGLIDDALLRRPGFTLRGGTNEILRGVVAKGLAKGGTT